MGLRLPTPMRVWLACQLAALLVVWVLRESVLNIVRQVTVDVLRWRPPDLEWKLIKLFVDVRVTLMDRVAVAVFAVVLALLVLITVARAGVARALGVVLLIVGGVYVARAQGVDLALGFVALVVPSLSTLLLLEAHAAWSYRRSNWLAHSLAWIPLVGLAMPCVATQVVQGKSNRWFLGGSMLVTAVLAGLTYRSPMSDVELGEHLAARLAMRSLDGGDVPVLGPTYTVVSAGEDVIGVTSLAPSGFTRLTRNGERTGPTLNVEVPELEQVAVFPDGTLRHFVNTGDRYVVIDPTLQRTRFVDVQIGRKVIACSTRCVADPSDPSRLVAMMEFEDEGWIFDSAGRIASRFHGTLYNANLVASRKDKAVYWNHMGGSPEISRLDVTSGTVRRFRAPGSTGDVLVREQAQELWVSLPTAGSIAIFAIPETGDAAPKLVRQRPAMIGARAIAIDEARGEYLALSGIGGDLLVRRLIDDEIVARVPTAPWARKVAVLPAPGTAVVSTAGGALVVRY